MSGKFKIGILDDEPKALALMAHYIKEEGDFDVLFQEDSPLKAMSLALEKELDLLITDIHMPNTNGIWVAQQMISHDIAVAITSGVWESAHMCINLDIVGFIHKPISQKGISDILEKYKLKYAIQSHKEKMLQVMPEKMFIKSNNPYIIESLDLNHVLYFKGAKDYAEIYFSASSGQKKLLYQISLHDITKSIEDPMVVRVHKSYVVNVRKIRKCIYDKAILEDGIEIPIGPSYRADLFKLLESRCL
ncbi:LytR/AlgR family response regulator transcription factor [Belliella pelovolcani]|uniref:Two component transcriptional regulator, LytTR family n=1 Tax=Belliella pelovolcani TaxID=529505 RepID=A0A1N7Q3Z6_9BACT|nr:LytTR family DNA-binding domain-containing protein [Belliella pelovolcani]SIT17555.1 two component transcriptional regulator, LytTR family [Belliella pelovolcani]